MEDFHDLLAGCDALEHLLAQGLFLDPLDEGLGHREIDIRLQQGHADLAQRVGHVALAQLAVAAQGLEDSFESVLEMGEHEGPGISPEMRQASRRRTAGGPGRITPPPGKTTISSPRKANLGGES